MRARIARYEASAKAATADPGITKLTYRGRPAYLVMSPCCDHFNYLYDASGKVLCAPSGGIAGSGDGRCPEALKGARP